jgi:hypothetical protein
MVTVICCQSLLAQRECATTQYVQEQRSLQPLMEQQLISVENQVQKNSSPSATARLSASTVVKIPVVVHVVYSNASQNISDEQVKSQIEALNRDFRRRNEDSAHTPASFRGVAADVMIEFYLATADPFGRPTTGIVRNKTTISEWRMDDKIKSVETGGADAWDSHSYLNIWVGQMRTLLGYSSMPGCSPEKDGIVISTDVFGTLNRSGVYNMGRTLVHETGHWLGLKHIWGDTHCGDDNVDDTPKQGGFTTGCPTGVRSTCSNTGDMYMNYMDFTNDACMNLFTYGQRNRMRALFMDGGARETFLDSKGLNAPWSAPLIAEGTSPSSFSAYPNPAQNFIKIQLDTDNRTASTIDVINLSGATVKREKITGSNASLNLSGLSAGIYYLQVNNGGQVYRQKFVKL